MKKGLILFFSLTLLLFGLVNVYADSTYKSIGEDLKVIGVITGDENGNLKEYSHLTREEAVVVLTRLMGMENAVAKQSLLSGFVDVPANNFYSPYIANAKLLGWTNGVSENEFGLGQPATSKMMVSYVLRALGYSADWSKENIMAKASNLGLTAGVHANENSAILRGEMFILMKNALQTDLNGSKDKLITRIGKEAQYSTLMQSKPFEVVGVSAEQTDKIVVEFSKPVDRFGMANAIKFNSTANVGDFRLDFSNDGRTMNILPISPLKPNTSYVLTLTKVKSLYGDVIDSATKVFSSVDTVLPYVVSAKAISAGQLLVEFSEPIKTVGTASVKLIGSQGDTKSTEIKAYNYKLRDDRRFLDIKMVDTFKDGRLYEVTFENFKDYSEQANERQVVDFQVEKNFDMPLMLVTDAEDYYAAIQFSKPVKGLTMYNFYNTNQSVTPMRIYSTVEDMKQGKPALNISSDKEYTNLVLQFADPADPNNTMSRPFSMFGTAAKLGFNAVTNGIHASDGWGYKMVNQSVTVGNITAGKPTFPTTPGAPGGVDDKTKPSILSARKYTVTGKDAIFVFKYSEPVDALTATDSNSYVFKDSADNQLGWENTNVSAFQHTGDKVQLSVPITSKIATATKFEVKNVKDLAGNVINSTSLAFDSSSDSIFVVRVARIGNKAVQVEFDRSINLKNLTTGSASFPFAQFTLHNNVGTQLDIAKGATFTEGSEVIALSFNNDITDADITAGLFLRYTAPATESIICEMFGGELKTQNANISATGNNWQVQK